MKKLSPQEELDVHVYTCHRKGLRCTNCEYEAETQDILDTHRSDNHQRENACAQCQGFERVELNYKLLKENYERLITINKNLQAQAKDKEYAQDVLISELRTNYDATKTENIKLKDDLETQNKLWKIWLERFDEKYLVFKK